MTSIRFALAASFLPLLSTTAFAGEPSHVVLGHGSTDGRALISELACVACHDPGAAKDLNLARPGPILTGIGGRITPSAIKAIVAQPAVAKPGTTMPDVLAGLGANEKDAAVESLVHYLAGQGGPLAAPAAGVGEAAVKRGQHLYHAVGCVACHAPLVGPPASEEDEEKDPTKRPIPKFEGASVPLGELATKYTGATLAGFLIDPLKHRPAGRMPSLLLSTAEAGDLAAYLLRDQLDRKSPLPAAGLRYAYYEADFVRLKDPGKLPVTEEGTAHELSTVMARRSREFAVRFTGDVEAAADGKYTFEFDSDEPVDLKVAGKTVPLPKPDNKKRPTVGVGVVALKKGKHAIELTYRHKEGEAKLKAQWGFAAGNGTTKDTEDTKKPENQKPEKKDDKKEPAKPGKNRKEQPEPAAPPVALAPLPTTALSHPGFKLAPKVDLSIPIDRAKAEKGKALFATAGCAACHAIDGVASTAKTAKGLLALDPSNKEGCLAEKPAAGRAVYALSADQRAAAAKGLVSLKAGEKEDPKSLVVRTMAALNCFACHARDGQGGPEAARAAYFTPVEELDLGDEGRLPPHVNEAGAKLTPEALTKILGGSFRVRPYMATRMPNFGWANVQALPAALASADAGKVPGHALASVDKPTPQMVDDGRRLVGVNGLGCVQCHSWGNLRSLGLPSVNLSLAPERLSPAYFAAYLLEPNKWRPGTRMPPFWAPGNKPAPEILGGDPQKQIDAIWAYLSAGPNAGMPAGMEPTDKSLLVPVDEPIVFRTFVDKQGAHTIAVGFRQKTHILFDALRVRTAAAWPGDFLRTEGAWNGRGGNYTGLPSQNVMQLPPAPALAPLDSQTTPWPEHDAKKHSAPDGWKFAGYRYDKARNPTFLYTYNDIAIEETPTAVFNPEGKGHLIRKLKLVAPAAPAKEIWFRAAMGKEVKANKPGDYAVDKALVQLRPASPDATIRANVVDPKNPLKELVTPIKWTPRAGGGVEAEIEIEMTW
ncbi:MAG: PA14 domain-containing protein [Phycisphaerae bacterium]|nr:PA14 domain-containing protein [Tepidisphaeraceae bacterium]